MASLTPRLLLRTPRTISKTPYICNTCLHRRQYANASDSTTTPAPPLLLKLRSDLKTAMRAKDTQRLNVLRMLLAEVTNQDKARKPYTSDVQLVGLVKKFAQDSSTRSADFRKAGREDLAEKEGGESEVLREYIGEVEMMPVEEVREEVQRAVEKIKGEVGGGKLKMGDVIKALLNPGGTLEGKAVERAAVVKMVQEAMKET